MNNLSYTQKYYMCVVNDDGSTSPWWLEHTTVTACFIVGGITELLNNGFIVYDEQENFVVAKPLDDTFSYLKPLYDGIISSDIPKNLRDVAESFYAQYSEKHLDKLLLAIGEYLFQNGYVEEVATKTFLSRKTKVKYPPKPEVVTQIIEKIRFEILEDGVISDKILCLTALLDKSGVIDQYFTKEERATLKQRIKDIRNSTTYAKLKDVKCLYDEFGKVHPLGFF